MQTLFTRYPRSARPFHLVELDPASDSRYPEVVRALKCCLLFSPQLVLPETQLIYNSYIKQLLQDTGFKELVQSEDATGEPNVKASVGGRDIYKLLEDRLDVKNRNQRAIYFHKLPKKQQMKYEALRGKRKLNVDSFCDLTDLRSYFDEVQQLFLDNDRRWTKIKGNGNTYKPTLVRAIGELKEAVRSTRIKRLCDRLEETAHLTKRRLRTAIWNELQGSGLGAGERRLMEKLILILPYHRATASEDGFDINYVHPQTSILLGAAAHGPSSALPVREWKVPFDSARDESLIIHLDKLEFSEIADIRTKLSFAENVGALSNALLGGDKKEAQKILRSHVRFLDDEIAKRVRLGESSRVPIIIEPLGDVAELALAGLVPHWGIPAAIFLRVARSVGIGIRRPQRRSLRIIGESLIQSSVADVAPGLSLPDRADPKGRAAGP